MEISGKIIQLLPKQTGEGKNGQWQKQDYVLETTGQYPKKVCFNLWGDKVDKFNLQNGDEVTVSFDIESREYNGRWYTDVRAWNIQKGMSNQNAPQQNAPQPANNTNFDPMTINTNAPDPFQANDNGGSDDLPF